MGIILILNFSSFIFIHIHNVSMQLLRWAAARCLVFTRSQYWIWNALLVSGWCNVH